MVQLAHVEMIPNGMVNAGMPILQEPKRVVSPFEFLPAWFLYTRGDSKRGPQRYPPRLGITFDRKPFNQVKRYGGGVQA